MFVPDSDDPEASLTIGNSDQPQSRLMNGERYRFKAAHGEPGWRLTSIKVTRVWSTQPLAAGARVAETNRGATPDAS